jgi:twitching motility protein PilT
MRRPELDSILTTMLDSQEEVSDLLFTVNRPFQVESVGELKPVTTDPPIERDPISVRDDRLESGRRKPVAYRVLRRGSCDSSYALSDKAFSRQRLFPGPLLDCLPKAEHRDPEP